jgi:N-acetylmuramoyl-L-alanine amidase
MTLYRVHSLDVFLIAQYSQNDNDMANRLIFLQSVMTMALIVNFSVHASSAPLIAIDVGHSLQSSGATSARGKAEFEFNRELALVVWQAIASNGGQAFEIGADGKSVDPETRPMEASARNAKFFLSIHHDSVQQQYLEEWNWQGGVQQHADQFSGFSLFVSRKNKQLAASLRCASAIGAALKSAGFSPSKHHAENIEGENRQWADQTNGVYYYDNLIVLKNTKIPAVLLEAGVIVNQHEEKQLLEPTVRKAIGNAIASGLGSCGMMK